MSFFPVAFLRHFYGTFICRGPCYISQPPPRYALRRVSKELVEKCSYVRFGVVRTYMADTLDLRRNSRDDFWVRVT